MHVMNGRDYYLWTDLIDAALLSVQANLASIRVNLFRPEGVYHKHKF
jgi:hypothetical protein